MKNKIIYLCILIIGFFVLFPNPYPNVHGNTNKAIQWCSDGGSDVGDPSCSGALCKCIDDYLEVHHLTDKEFPTYVWLNSGHQHDRLFPYDYFILVKFLSIFFGLAIIYIRIYGFADNDYKRKILKPILK